MNPRDLLKLNPSIPIYDSESGYKHYTLQTPTYGVKFAIEDGASDETYQRALQVARKALLDTFYGEMHLKLIQLTGLVYDALQHPTQTHEERVRVAINDLFNYLSGEG